MRILFLLKNIWGISKIRSNPLQAPFHLKICQLIHLQILHSANSTLGMHQSSRIGYPVRLAPSHEWVTCQKIFFETNNRFKFLDAKNLYSNCLQHCYLQQQSENNLFRAQNLFSKITVSYKVPIKVFRVKGSESVVSFSKHKGTKQKTFFV
jgi:hypothetical protein